MSSFVLALHKSSYWKSLRNFKRVIIIVFLLTKYLTQQRNWLFVNSVIRVTFSWKRMHTFFRQFYPSVWARRLWKQLKSKANERAERSGFWSICLKKARGLERYISLSRIQSPAPYLLGHDSLIVYASKAYFINYFGNELEPSDFQ